MSRPPLHFPGLFLMDSLRLKATRRNVVRGFATAAVSFVLPCPSYAKSAARVVVIGGGFGGATCARALRKIDSRLQVTLVEPNRLFTACPFSNEVIAGLRGIEGQQFSYDKIVASGVSVVAQTATKVDPTARTVGLADGTSLAYDRLVIRDAQGAPRAVGTHDAPFRVAVPGAFHSAMPSWCLVVRQPQVMPADFAALAHCSVSRLNGLNTLGGSLGSPHSLSWKVATLKWMNMPKRRSTNSC